MKSFVTLGSLVALCAAPLAAQQTPVSLDTLHVAVGARTSARLPVAVRTVQVIDAAAIRAMPAATVADVLAWAVGVDVLARSPAQADVSIRGGGIEQVLVLVDGVRASDAQTGHFDLDLAVPLAEVERIEILRGPASAQYGADAVGGVINVVTRRAGGLRGRVEGGSDATAGLSVGGSFSPGAASIVWGGAGRRGDGTRADTDYRMGQGRLGLDAPLAGGRARADAAFAARDFGAADFYAPYESYERTRTLTAAVAWTGDAGGVRLQPRLSARRHADDFILKRADPSFYRNRHTSWQLGGELSGRAMPVAGVTVAFGGEAFADVLRSNALGDRDATRAALFGEAAAGTFGRAVVQAGARLDWHSDYGSFVAPSVAGAVWLRPSLRLRASLGRSYRAPTWTDRYYRDPANIGNEALRPERAWSGEVGAEWMAGRSVRVDVAGFVRKARDVIDWARPAGTGAEEPWHTMNVERATFRGIEVSVAADALGTHWSASATSLGFDADDASGFTSKYALRPLSETIALSAERALAPGLRLALRGRRARHAGESAYVLADARLSYAWRELRLRVDGTNLLDADYLDVSAQRAPGRLLLVGLDWSLR